MRFFHKIFLQLLVIKSLDPDPEMNLVPDLELDPDQDSHWPKILDPNPHRTYANIIIQHWEIIGTVFFLFSKWASPLTIILLIFCGLRPDYQYALRVFFKKTKLLLNKPQYWYFKFFHLGRTHETTWTRPSQSSLHRSDRFFFFSLEKDLFI